MKENATKYGCKFANIYYVCEETQSLASVRSWCPESCGCRNSRLGGCPSTCQEFTSPARNYYLDEEIHAHLVNYNDHVQRIMKNLTGELANRDASCCGKTIAYP